jgi:hypothetical protein
LRYQIDKIEFALDLESLKGRWDRARAKTVLDSFSKLMDEGKVHVHFHSGADNICSIDHKVTIWVDVSDPETSGQIGVNSGGGPTGELDHTG